jgi:hypothetical protein
LETLWILTKGYFNSSGIHFHRKGSNYYTGKKMTINYKYMTNVLSDRPNENIYTEDKIRGRYTFLARKKMYKPIALKMT